MTAIENERPASTLLITPFLAALLLLVLLVPQGARAQSAPCAFEVYDYCFSQGRNVDSSTCTCNYMSCLGVPESDCTEQGMYLNYGSCTCVGNPGYVFVCDSDPYAYGCPRSFDTVFGDQLRVRDGDPMIGGGNGDICSFSSYAWCNANSGSWSSYGCACSGVVGTNPQNACETDGGTWYNPGNSAGGGVCYNPSGYGSGSQCAVSPGSMNGCISSGGRWNPYTCTCTP